MTERTIQFIREPTDLQCGQAVLAMATQLTAEQVARELKNDRETNLKEMKSFLRSHGLRVLDERIQVADKSRALFGRQRPVDPGDVDDIHAEVFLDRRSCAEERA